MSAKHKEIAVQLLHVDLEMRSTLRPIYNDGNIVFVGNADNFFDRIDCTEHVANVRNADNLSLWTNHFLEGLQVHCTVIIHRNDFQYNAFSGLLELPGHDIGMVFDGRDDDFIAFLHESFTET